MMLAQVLLERGLVAVKFHVPHILKSPNYFGQPDSLVCRGSKESPFRHRGVPRDRVAVSEHLVFGLKDEVTFECIGETDERLVRPQTAEFALHRPLESWKSLPKIAHPFGKVVVTGNI